MKKVSDKITQREVALALGLDVSTVSKALRNHPAVAEATKVLVRSTAEEMGYHPHPMLSALARWREARKRARKQADSSAVLAWVYNHGRSTAMHRFAAYGEYLRGGKARAKELGYRVDEFWIGPGGINAQRLGQVLLARGLTGVIVAPQQTPGAVLHLPWERLAAVTIGYTLAEPALHIVSNDHFQTMTTLVDHLVALGRKRIGLYLWKEDDRRVSGRTGAAFAAWSKVRRIPIMAYEQAAEQEFLAWVRRHRLDAVITREHRAKRWLKSIGYCVPQEVMIASYALEVNEPGPGMDHQNAAIGAAAVDWIARLIERGETGLPCLAARHLVPGCWRYPTVTG